MKTEPETEPTSASRAFRFRWWLLVAATLCLIAGLSWFAAPLLTTELSDAGQLAPTTLLPTAAFLGFEAPETKLDYALGLTTFLGVLLLTQWMFLRPRRGWALQLNRESRPLKTAAVAAALMAMMLTVGAMATVGEVASGDWLDWPDNSGIFLGTTGLWVVWALVFYIHSRRLDRVTGLQRTTRALIAGSVLELFVAISVYAWNPHDDDCWCARGSYTGLVFAGTVMVWAFGPGLVLLFLQVRRRRPQAARHPAVY